MHPVFLLGATAYLIAEERLTVIDAGLPGSWLLLRRAIRRIGRDAGQIARILLTHEHPDHAGGARAVARATGVEMGGAAQLADGELLGVQGGLAVLIALFCCGVISDWIDGPLARRRGETAEGRARDLRADSLLTLGAAIAALRHARLLWPALLAPAAHYLARAPRDDDERRWDRATGVAQMSLFALSWLGRR